MRFVLAVAAFLMAGSLAACGLVEGLSSFSEGPCSGGDCDAGLVDATADVAVDSGAEAALDSTTPPVDAMTDSGSTVDSTTPPSGDGGRVLPDSGMEVDGSDGGGGCGTCAGGCCNGGPKGTCEPYASESALSCGTSGTTCQACPAGEACDTTNGQCICNASSCPNGCCNGSTCVPYAMQTAGTCGAAGVACSPCLSGQDCSTTNGQCICDTTSCPHGCCNGTSCVGYAAQTPGTCGTGGVTCAGCANGLCDKTNGACTCDAETCPNGCCSGGATGTCLPYASESTTSCGVGAATCGTCPGGTECDKTSGQCVCDATSCPHGCCDGNTCVAYTGQSITSCGTAGAACAPCGATQACTSGVCSCGGTACAGCCNGSTCLAYGSETPLLCGASGATCQPCGANLDCNTANGQCVCDANSCPHGCCNGNTCVPYASQSFTGCGTGGAQCTACGTGLDCSTTTGTCVCDAARCPGGCCSGNTCVAYAAQTPTECGANGATCGTCSKGLCDTTNGTCACDSNTCPNGCCNGGPTGTCESFTGQSITSCGGGGASCASCNGGCCSSSNGGACDTQHSDGLGGFYYDCNPLGTDSAAEAQLACQAYAASVGGSASDCSGGYQCCFNSHGDSCTPGSMGCTCTGGVTVCYAVGTNPGCTQCWGYTAGVDQGWQESCSCPEAKVGTWN